MQRHRRPIGMTNDRPPFGRHRRLQCEDCGKVEREWWSTGYGPSELVDPTRDRQPIPDACPCCGGAFQEEVALVDPTEQGIRTWLNQGGE